ncbi:hypothetical protein F5148DRAFT_1206073 [Russula earlei]|uniref:Uncharacterized protein n=1 Tax=Russula earlei TaxID=71964 RepID=A0ACC0U871_9AGAM|nr:hypothetical protein F5148DRAFT_1206073 [Russula earlei]
MALRVLTVVPAVLLSHILRHSGRKTHTHSLIVKLRMRENMRSLEHLRKGQKDKRTWSLRHVNIIAQAGEKATKTIKIERKKKRRAERVKIVHAGKKMLHVIRNMEWILCRETLRKQKGKYACVRGEKKASDL